MTTMLPGRIEVLTWLQKIPGVVAQTTRYRIFMDRAQPPPTWLDQEHVSHPSKPEEGAALCVHLRGGVGRTEHAATRRPRLQLLAYGGGRTETAQRASAAAILTAIEQAIDAEQFDGGVIAGERASEAQVIEPIVAGWPTMLLLADVTIRPRAGA
jgi:hypothetical protein